MNETNQISWLRYQCLVCCFWYTQGKTSAHRWLNGLNEMQLLLRFAVGKPMV
jgi:hypothetical protein